MYFSYISEWDNDGKGLTSNIRVTTKVGVHALLSKDFKDVGSALIYNMVTKEVKSAVSTVVRSFTHSLSANHSAKQKQLSRFFIT